MIFVNNANETQANQISGYINNFINSKNNESKNCILFGAVVRWNE